MEHIKIKKARKSLIYTLLEVFGKPAGGESGIRTLDTLLGYTHFPGVLLRPLGQLSFFVKKPLVEVLFKRERKDSTNIIMRKFLSPTIINRLKKRLFLLKKRAKNTHNTEKLVAGQYLCTMWIVNTFNSRPVRLASSLLLVSGALVCVRPPLPLIQCLWSNNALIVMFGYLALGLCAYIFDLKRLMYTSLLSCAIIAFYNHETAGSASAGSTPCQQPQHRCVFFNSQDITAEFGLQYDGHSKED